MTVYGWTAFWQVFVVCFIIIGGIGAFAALLTVWMDWAQDHEIPFFVALIPMLILVCAVVGGLVAIFGLKS